MAKSADIKVSNKDVNRIEKKLKKEKKTRVKLDFWSQKLRKLSIFLYIVGSLSLVVGVFKLLQNKMVGQDFPENRDWVRAPHEQKEPFMHRPENKGFEIRFPNPQQEKPEHPVFVRPQRPQPTPAKPQYPVFNKPQKPQAPKQAQKPQAPTKVVLDNEQEEDYKNIREYLFNIFGDNGRDLRMRHRWGPKRNQSDNKEKRVPHDKMDSRHPRRHHTRGACAIIFGIVTLIVSILGFNTLRNMTASRAKCFKFVAVLYNLILSLVVVKDLVRGAFFIMKFTLDNDIALAIEHFRFKVPFAMIASLIFLMYLCWSLKTAFKFFKVMNKYESKFGVYGQFTKELQKECKKKQKKENKDDIQEVKEEKKDKKVSDKKESDEIPITCSKCQCKIQEQPKKETKMSSRQVPQFVQPFKPVNYRNSNYNPFSGEVPVQQKPLYPNVKPSVSQTPLYPTFNRVQPANLNNGIPTGTMTPVNMPVKPMRSNMIDKNLSEEEIMSKWTTPIGLNYEEFKVNNPELNINYAYRPVDGSKGGYQPPQF